MNAATTTRTASPEVKRETPLFFVSQRISSATPKIFSISYLLTLLLLLSFQLVQAQVYVEKKSRHRFAQLNFGIDYESSFGGETTILVAGERVQLPNMHQPRLIIGGTHFWGHADFAIAIPVGNPTATEGETEVSFDRGVETQFKFYPWQLRNKKLRPMVGFSFATATYRQQQPDVPLSKGPLQHKLKFPLLFGFSYMNGNNLFHLEAAWNYNNQHDYYISKTQTAAIETPPLWLAFGYKRMLDSTLGGEADWESGRTAKRTKQLAEAKKLNGWYIGVGPSAAFWLNKSDYLSAEHPYLGPMESSIFADFALGYYWHKPDLNANLAYRSYSSEAEAYGTKAVVKRTALTAEAFKFLGDYHGFVPFVGPALSREWLQFDSPGASTDGTAIRFGLTFGWDIRPNRLQSMLLRTNLRWFPQNTLAVSAEQSINFSSLEFNFIQLVLFPGRMF